MVTSATAGTIGGTATFYDNGVSIGTGAVISGVATFTTSTLGVGTHPITVTFAPATGSNYATSSSTALNQVVNALPSSGPTPSVTGSLNPSFLILNAGSSGNLTLTLTPVGGYTGTVSFSCGALPAHVTCIFTPQTVAITGSGAATDTVTIQTSNAGTAMMAMPARSVDRSVFVAIGLAPGLLGLLIPAVRRRKLRLPTMLALSLVLAGLGMLSGCGATSPNAAPGTYNVAISIQVPGVGAQVVNATLTVR
jgi:hypothetical protein